MNSKLLAAKKKEDAYSEVIREIERLKLSAADIRSSALSDVKSGYRELLMSLQAIREGVIVDGNQSGTVMKVKRSRAVVDIAGKLFNCDFDVLWPNVDAELPQAVRDAIEGGYCLRVYTGFLGQDCIEHMPVAPVHTN